ncbi:NAD(P)H dehydrogenase (quinone) [Acaryochloris thomasi RCC1774]|uniref:NAD(P)H dehydrogenase (Quinone) n=1 Tax=Acaryochloris thomasi RCC1774 TaxID=1764569 RepID=A0A2W1JR42_9CYAN|nr:flavodoxin domain-containing protein [Acaryochloris thomasi]PZD73302.1 NAD(P)H dehydrogenase (quinone) [Acaryochloris thomasi RCC1774]
MTNILIVYTTSLGNTEKMAKAIADGTRSVAGAEVIYKSSNEVEIDHVKTCQALIVGTPIRHRTADARIKAFIEDTLEKLWLTDDMVGKVGGVFSVGGGYGNMGAGCELAQLGILSAMAACGMVLVTLPKTTPGFDVAGMHWGPNGRSGGPKMEPVGVTTEMLETAYHHGANVARVAVALDGQTLMAHGNIAPSPEIVDLFLNG